MANKQQLLDKLFEAMEKKYSADLARDRATHTHSGGAFPPSS